MEDRIKQIMESQKLTQQNFAQILDLSPASLSSIFSHRTKPTMNHVSAIHKRFPNINMQWLLFGEGTMYGKSEEASGTSTPSVATGEQNLFGQQNIQQPTVNTYQSTPSIQHPAPVQEVKYIDKPTRKISEIRVFYDDQTWESFMVKK